MPQKRIQLLEHSPAQPAVDGLVNTLPEHSNGRRVILTTDQAIYTSFNSEWLVDMPSEGWRTYSVFPGIELIFRNGEWVEDISILEDMPIPEMEIPELEIPAIELDKDDTDKHFTISVLNTDNVVINHNLNKEPAVQIVNESGKICLADVEHIDLNTSRITFSDLFTGRVTFN